MERDFKIVCDAPAKVSYRNKKNILGQSVPERYLEKIECGKVYFEGTLCECSPRAFSKCDYYLKNHGMDWYVIYWLLFNINIYNQCFSSCNQRI